MIYHVKKLIIDANVLIAALIKNEATAHLLYSKNLQLFAPAELLVEVRKRQDLIQRKSCMDDKQFEKLLEVFKRRITFVENEKFIDLLNEAEKISPDEGDTLYLALSLKLSMAIWSNDKALKDGQDKVVVYNTGDIARILRNLETTEEQVE